MSKDFNQVIENRRSIYAIGKESSVSEDEIQQIVEHAVKHVPSSFNSQSGRVVVLLGEHHDRLWDITKEVLRGLVPEANFAPTQEKLESFRNGYGSILFFEDQSVIESLQEQFALYKDNFPVWSLQSSGMLQFTIWSALEAAGLGASLQHYNPLIDDLVQAEWNLPKEWKLLAEMPFGNPLEPAQEKYFAPLEDRVKVFG